MSAPARLGVELGPRRYDILVGAGLLAAAGEALTSVLRGRRVIVITDRNLLATGHPATLAASLDAAGIDHHQIALPAGEASKSLSQLDSLLDQILTIGVERTTAILALGGGVIGDLAGFAAAVLLRGLDLVQLPTTLLAQVDSAVGGKTGVNSRHGKNLIGAFHQPRLVLADPDVLATLPPRELRAGYAEVVKYGLIDRPQLFAWLEAKAGALLAGDASIQRDAVLESCRAKAAIVAADEREAGRRALLNLGHTFAHALEAASGYGSALRHGEAVALGIQMAFRLSVQLGHCPAADALRVRQHFAAVGLPTDRRQVRPEGFATDVLLDAMARDKKVEHGRPRFVLVRGIGQAFTGAEVDPAALRALLDAGDV